MNFLVAPFIAIEEHSEVVPFIRHMSSKASLSPHSRGMSMKSLRNKHMVLVAEDTAMLQKLITAQLDMLGYDARICANGQEVLDALQQQWYAVCVVHCVWARTRVCVSDCRFVCLPVCVCVSLCACLPACLPACLRVCD